MSTNKRCTRCQATTKVGERCKLKTCKSTYCWIHLKQKKGLRIKKSKLKHKNAGLGLFATKKMKKNTVIAKYKGEHMTRKEVFERYGSKRGEYVLCNGNKAVSKCIDARNTNSCAARFANSSYKSKYKTNAKLTSAFNLKSLNRGIPKNAEILVSYGKKYWKK